MRVHGMPASYSPEPERQIYGLCPKCGRGVYSRRSDSGHFTNWTLEGVLVGVEIGADWRTSKAGTPYHHWCHEEGTNPMIAVKPLEWKEWGPKGDLWRASTPISEYCIAAPGEHHEDTYHWWNTSTHMWQGTVVGGTGYATSLENAMKAATDDYEARVRMVVSVVDPD